MNPIARTFLLPGLLLCAAGAATLFAVNHGSAQAQSASNADKPLAEYQRKLIDLAFTSVSAMPANPHKKNRSRAEESVVATCFELDQPQRALALVERIDDWRKGSGYADYAFYRARHGETKDVQHFLDLAQQISDQGEPTISQDWQKDRIRVAIAKTHAWLGEPEQAARFEAGLEHADMGKVDAVRAMRSDGTEFDEQLRALDAVFAHGDFDLVHNALETCAQLFDRHYDEPTRRNLMEERIKTSWGKLPLQVRIEVLMELARFALDHKDEKKALALVDDAQAILDSGKWLPENVTPLAAPLALLRYEAGDRGTARTNLDALLALYESQRGLIVDIYRAGTLRPIAEAYQRMGETAKALAVYARAVEEGAANPNARPRAEDLSATCCSMAKCAVEPDAQLWKKLDEVAKGLKDPW